MPHLLRSLLQAPAILNYLIFSDDFVISHFHAFIPSSPSAKSGSGAPLLCLSCISALLLRLSSNVTSSGKTSFSHIINTISLCLLDSSWTFTINRQAISFILYLPQSIKHRHCQLFFFFLTSSLVCSKLSLICNLRLTSQKLR